MIYSLQTKYRTRHPQHGVTARATSLQKSSQGFTENINARPKFVTDWPPHKQVASVPTRVICDEHGMNENNADIWVSGVKF